MSNNYEDLIKNARVNAECGEHMSPEEVTTLLNVVETTFAALAAENAGIKEYLAPVGLAVEGIPATEAFLAEVRAQGVEMFAAHKRERQQALRSRSMRISEEAAGMAADAENFADELRKGVQS
ncbi:hypothetical protein I5532_02385 [Citrobacter freundii]|jgi:hypothetical protein|uniref:hypothetical protein n=1 Tax=Citrobacter freundii TaxID=546 RepID=UPI0019066B31|nr:hypothetical protein [Citrobacter freundii]MBJ9631512.1 hypothetical protein [Citrobacter freundii]